MDQALLKPCPHCGRGVHCVQTVCGACGGVVPREHKVYGSVEGAMGMQRGIPVTAEARPVATPPAIRVRDGGSPLRRVPPAWFFLGLGLVTAPAFLGVCGSLLQRMGWFLASLVHEIGHTALSWFFGCPAVPAIRLDGHAAAVHGRQLEFLCAAIFGGLAYLTWVLRMRRPLVYVLGGLTLLYPVLAFTSAREFFFLISGHLGELAFAGFCFWRVLHGGFSKSAVERALYGTVGWFLVLRNVKLTGGLMWDREVRFWYERSGSFGITNDYIRLHRLLGWDLEGVAFPMTLLAAAVLPLTWWAYRIRRRRAL